ncbi:MAG: arsenic efflux protein [Deltaproteobacteria bacterium]|nr:arsenic efflux protein [Deltaproteobacteria bacterium]
MLNVILNAAWHGTMITIFILMMMLLVDYLNVATKGELTLGMQKSRGRQYATAALLGASPGCLGAFLSVTLYVHGLVSFGGMTTAAVATVGDETFMMLAMFPGKAVMLLGVLMVLAVPMGYVADLINDRFHVEQCETCGRQEVHDHPDCVPMIRSALVRQLLHPTAKRLLLVAIVGTALVLLATGAMGPEGWNAWRILFVALGTLATFIALTVPDRYVSEHVWNHLMVHHLPRVAMWTIGTLVVLVAVQHFVDVTSFVKTHMPWVLVSGLLIGLIPTSGPNLVFVALFAQGSIPFSVLLANSIVQDGHGMLPLLGTSVRDVVIIKGYKVVVAAALGSILLVFGL